ncbi:MAG: hypothetical protein NZ108_10530, partial [Bacteroidia bacterium]|nr:hypothetical protein [Bacteroidia bacterium]
VDLMHPNDLKADQIRTFLNQNFRQSAAQSGFQNRAEDAIQIQNYITDVFQRLQANQLWDPWGVGSAFYNDMRVIYFTEEILKKFMPELLVVNLQDIDICHTHFSNYCRNIRRADWAVGHLWQTIQSTPGLANDTVLIITPEVGRNAQPNAIRDQFGRGALDHTGDSLSRELFCLIAGPASIVKQNQVFVDEQGEIVDVVPTICELLGTPVPTGMVDGRFLTEAFV